jgi:hypothetical protein
VVGAVGWEVVVDGEVMVDVVDEVLEVLEEFLQEVVIGGSLGVRALQRARMMELRMRLKSLRMMTCLPMRDGLMTSDQCCLSTIWEQRLMMCLIN